MKSITKFLKVARSLKIQELNKGFCETQTPDHKITISLKAEELADLQAKPLKHEPIISIVRKLKSPENPQSIELADKIEKDLQHLFSNDEKYATTLKEFTSTRNLNQTNHDLLTQIKNKIKKNDDAEKTIRLQKQQELEKEKANAEKKFALALIDTVHQLISNYEKVNALCSDHSDPLVVHTLSGLRMIEQNAITVLRRFGIETFPTEVGVVYDPSYHQTENQNPQGKQITAVLKIGFRMNDTVISKSLVELAN